MSQAAKRRKRDLLTFIKRRVLGFFLEIPLIAIDAGTATITATALNCGDDKTATCTVTVSSVPVTDVTLSQTEAAMTVGGDIFTLAGKLIPSNDSTEGQVHRAKAVC